MLDLILAVAMEMDAVRAVYLQGSRANPQAPRDEWQDYDIVYLVNELCTLIADHRWIDRFGERLILQMPEAMELLPPANDGTFPFLMLFTDGNRIDLTLIPLAVWEQRAPDSLSVQLLDKDGRRPALPEPSEADYFPALPTPNHYRDCCNEFRWTLTYVVKGLGRNEIIYAKAIQERVVRPMLEQMIVWEILRIHGERVNPGKHGKYFRQLLPAAHWEALLNTYTDSRKGAVWSAILTMSNLFEELAVGVADHFGFPYDSREAENIKSYLYRHWNSSSY
ncbi:aminoglycoside adenylyltransferase [Flavilitoribacter nigricans DSM 23189 = NBRC 102662]|uniref:Aminoglycoside adenylyltransferase n=2 Tax=Flavilitoribacter TaxID=2762562 RepID=A0A2D0MZ37_FLAN2|nr:aminoglycoside adenylyltransferase [Flavilitoribacter nigricans DSM 23189 = NBRC 102662]